MCATNRRRAASGFSLIELIVSLVVLGLVFAGFASVFGSVLRHAGEPPLRQQAVAVAGSYLEEILSRPYPSAVGGSCPAPTVARPQFASPCDYDGLAANGCTSSSAACPVPGDCVCDRSGAPVDGLAGFVVNVSVTPGTIAGAAGLIVDVDVNHAGLPGDALRLTAFRTPD